LNFQLQSRTCPRDCGIALFNIAVGHGDVQAVGVDGVAVEIIAVLSYPDGIYLQGAAAVLPAP